MRDGLPSGRIHETANPGHPSFPLPFPHGVCGPPALATGAKDPQDSEAARDFKPFLDRVRAYVKMQKSLEASLPALKTTKDPAQIVECQHGLAAKIVEARRDAPPR